MKAETVRHEIDPITGACWCGSGHNWELAKVGYCQCTHPRCPDTHRNKETP